MSVNIQTLKDIQNYLLEELKNTYPRQEIEAITNRIFKTHFDIDRLQLLIGSGEKVSPKIADRFVKIVGELKTGKPVQYILGETSFYNCIIKVNRDTLIPRPETEELVDLIIRENIGFRGKIIDIGTGSGCIAIAIKKSLQEAEVTGMDCSPGAIATARSNADLNNVDVDFVRSDIFKSDVALASPADIIVSNPPYVLESEKKYMHRNIIDFEPHGALFVPDDDPLIFYRAIIGLSLYILVPRGKLYFEINERKGEEILELLQSAGFSDSEILKDINGKDRFIKGTLNG